MKVRSESDPTVVGFLDFEFCAPAPRLMEVAALIMGMRSHPDAAVKGALPAVLAAYERKAGEPLNRRLLPETLVAYNFTAYMYHRGLVLAGKAGPSRMEGRLDDVAQVLQLATEMSTARSS